MYLIYFVLKSDGLSKIGQSNFGIFYLIIFFNEILQSLHQVKLQINLYDVSVIISVYRISELKEKMILWFLSRCRDRRHLKVESNIK